MSFQTDDDFVSSISGLMIWLLYGYLSDRRGSLSHLLAVWPAAATRTGSVFRRHIAASRIFPHRLLREPLSFDLWHLLWEQRGAIYAKLPLYRC